MTIIILYDVSLDVLVENYPTKSCAYRVWIKKIKMMTFVGGNISVLEQTSRNRHNCDLKSHFNVGTEEELKIEIDTEGDVKLVKADYCFWDVMMSSHFEKSDFFLLKHLQTKNRLSRRK